MYQSMPGLADPNKILLNDKKTELILQLKDGSFYSKNLVNNYGVVNLNQNAITILEDIVNNSHENLVKCAVGYRETNRDYKTFIYDLFTLALLLEKLPSKFSKLKKINPDSTDLMHNRIHAQIAHYYQASDNRIGIPTETDSDKKPDLQVDDKYVEIKTMLKRFVEPKAYFNNFKSQLDSGLEQVGNGGLVVIGMWSSLFNAVFREYVGTSRSNYILSENKTEITILLEGDYPLYDEYFTKPVNIMNEIMNTFCNEGGYDRTYGRMTLLKMSRNCFTVSAGRHGSGNFGIAFSVG